MAILEILEFPDPRLRTIARPVERVDDAADYAQQSFRGGNTPLANRVLGDVWRRRGDRDQATRYYTMYLSLSDHPADEAAIREWLLQPRAGDITIPAK